MAQFNNDTGRRNKNKLRGSNCQYDNINGSYPKFDYCSYISYLAYNSCSICDLFIIRFNSKLSGYCFDLFCSYW